MDALSPPVLAAIAGAIAGLATIGGLGGAVLLVPIIVLLGVDPADAVPLGLLLVAAGSLGAAAPQIERGLVNQRVGVVIEVAASAGAIVGAAVSGVVPSSVLRVVLGGVAILAGLAGMRRSVTVDARRDTSAYSVGELPGRLAGVVPTHAGTTTYEVVRVRSGFTAMLGAGFVAGLSGTGGGYMKTPLLHYVMGIPAKAAAATTTFTVGITAAAALGVLVLQGRLALTAGSAVVIGAIVGGRVGSFLQHELSGRVVRIVLWVALLAIGVIVVMT